MVAAIANVQSVEERLYQNQIDAGLALFQSYAQAKSWQYWMMAQVANAKRNKPLCDAATQGFISWGERVYGKGFMAGKTYTTSSVANGSALVPESFSPDIIKNLLHRGVARKLARVTPMAEPRVIVPRRTGGLTMYYPVEGVAGTESTGTYDNVTLEAKAGVVTATASNQIMQDGGVLMAEETFSEILDCIALAEDTALLVGDGSATYAGMSGFEHKYGKTATDTGQSVLGGNDAVTHTATELSKAIGRLPDYVFRGTPRIVCHQVLVGEIFYRLAASTGGMQMVDDPSFGRVPSYLGIPIIGSSVMSSVTVASTTPRPGFTSGDQIDCLIGDFSRAARLGDRLSVDLATDGRANFHTNSTTFRGVVQHDIVVHDTGTTSAAGPVVAFWQT
jgi:HK97 family phage major capsid protein